METNSKAGAGQYLTEEQIERRVERDMDRIDNALIRGDISRVEYELKVDRIDEWAKEQYGLILWARDTARINRIHDTEAGPA
jgi:hypothetical protein